MKKKTTIETKEIAAGQQKRREALINNYGKKAADRGITDSDVVRIVKETRLKEGRDHR